MSKAAEVDPSERATLQATSRNVAARSVNELAARGVAGAGGALPHHDVIQRSFGPQHDVGAVRAHVGGHAATAAGAIGAEAYATGDAVAFSAAPDLHTAAHEAAHVIQQRAGKTNGAKEQEADAIADAVVAGRSAAPLLDKYEGASGGDAAVQRKDVVATNPGNATDELQLILETGDVTTIDAALESLRFARERRSEEPEGRFDYLALFDEEDTYYLTVTRVAANQMYSAMRARKQELQGQAVEPAWETFALAFNTTFSSILNGFALGTDKAGSKRDGVSANRLRFLFTVRQREQLSQFFEDNLIPERLFNGDEVGGTSAQQRILLASHILANGKYKPGSYEQEIHALACYHFVRIVYHYAGATSASAKGLTGTFDHAGGVMLSTGKATEPIHATKDRELTDQEIDKRGEGKYRFKHAEWSLVSALEPGDWIYIYNGNKSASGAHSQVFAGWTGEVEGTADTPYRKALVYDQGKPESGPRSREEYLGANFSIEDGKQVFPVNQITRMNPDAMPADSIDALTPDKRPSSTNAKFVKKLLQYNRGKQFDVTLFHAWLRAQNAAHIASLAAQEGRLTAGQHELLLSANESEDDHVLVCLYQRLTALVVNSNILFEADEKNFGGKEAAYAAAKEVDDARIRELAAEQQTYEAELEVEEIAAAPLRDEIDALDMRDEIKELRAEKTALRAVFQATPKSNRVKRNEILGEMQQIDQVIAAIKTSARSNKPELLAARHALAAIEKRERRLYQKLEKIETELARLGHGPAVFGLVHNGNKAKQLKQPIDGSYAHMPGHVEWATFLTAK